MKQRSTTLFVAGLVLVSACSAPRPSARVRIPRAMPTIGCIAVLPFDNLTAEEGAGETMSDLVTIDLLQTGRYDVLDRAEAGRLLSVRGINLGTVGDRATGRALGSALGVDAVVIGTVSTFDA